MLNPFINPTGLGMLGQKIGDWFVALVVWLLKNTPQGRLIVAAFSVSEYAIDHPKETAKTLSGIFAKLPTPATQTLAMILAFLGGEKPSFLRDDWQEIVTEIAKHPDKYFERVIATMKETPIDKFYLDMLGNFVIENIFRPITALLDNPKEDPEKVLASTVGRIAGIVLAVNAFGVVAEIVGVGQIQTVALALNKLVDTLDLRGIINRMTNPILGNAYNEFGRRYYNKRWRLQRWTVSELVQLYALHSLTRSEFNNAMAEEGFRDEDIQRAVELAEKRPSPSEVLAALELGMITKAQAAERLHAAGYSTDAIQFELSLLDAKERQNDLSQISGVAVTALKKGLISETQYRQMRSAGKVPQERIDLEIQLAALGREVEKKDLTVSNIKAAYLNNVLARQEADGYMRDLEIDTTARQIMLDTWDEEKRPKAQRLNAGTISNAYRLGLLDREQSIQKLISVNWSRDDASLIIDVVDARKPQEVPPPSEADVLSAYDAGLIAYEQAIAHLQAIGLSGDAAALDLRMATIRPYTPTKTLTKAEVIDLLDMGVFTFDDAVSYLVVAGYDYQTAQLVIVANSKMTEKPTTLKG